MAKINYKNKNNKSKKQTKKNHHNNKKVHYILPPVCISSQAEIYLDDSTVKFRIGLWSAQANQEHSIIPTAV